MLCGPQNGQKLLVILDTGYRKCWEDFWLKGHDSEISWGIWQVLSGSDVKSFFFKKSHLFEFLYEIGMWHHYHEATF